VSNEKKEPEGFDEEELIRSEFESIVSGLNLDQSSPSTYLDDLDRIQESEGFVQPNPPPMGLQRFYNSAKLAVQRWLKRGNHDDDGAAL
jgi:hypothetical protein